MTGQECLAVIKELAKCQGLYSRLLKTYNEMSAQQQEFFLNALEEEKFSDPVDLILFIEQ